MDGTALFYFTLPIALVGFASLSYGLIELLRASTRRYRRLPTTRQRINDKAMTAIALGCGCCLVSSLMILIVSTNIYTG